jgi:hypothetical protein
MRTNLYVIGMITIAIGIVWYFGNTGLVWVGCGVVGGLVITGYVALFNADVDRAVRARTMGNRGGNNNSNNSNKGGNADNAAK